MFREPSTFLVSQSYKKGTAKLHHLSHIQGKTHLKDVREAVTVMLKMNVQRMFSHRQIIRWKNCKYLKKNIYRYIVP